MKSRTHWLWIPIALLVLGTWGAHGDMDYNLVAEINLVVSDANGTVIAQGGPWAYEPFGQYLLPGVPAGPDRTLSVWTTDANGMPSYTGRIEHVDIMMEDPFMGTATIVVLPEADRLGLYYDVFGFELASVDLTPLVETTLEVDVDIKPRSKKNPFAVRSRGVVHAAIVGSDTLDVSTIDPTSITLAGVSAIRHRIKDVCGMVRQGKKDRVPDLLLTFRTADLAATLVDPQPKQVVKLPLVGALLDGTVIEGLDTITLVGRPDKRPRAPTKVRSVGIR